VTSLGTPLRVGDAGHGRGVEILDRDGLTVANGLPWAREEIVRLVNATTDLLKALRIAVADSCGGCGRETCYPCSTLETVEVANA